MQEEHKDRRKYRTDVRALQLPTEIEENRAQQYDSVSEFDVKNHRAVLQSARFDMHSKQEKEKLETD